MIPILENAYLPPGFIYIGRREGSAVIICHRAFDVEQLLFRDEVRKIVRDGLYAAYPSLAGVGS